MKVYIITIIAIFICSALVSMFLIYSYRRWMLKLYDSILQKLDKTIGCERLNIVYDESMDSAISERLNRIVEMFNMQKGKAEEERDAVKSLISDMCHQIRTPLSNITLYTDLLKEEMTDAKGIMLSDKIQKNAEKLEFFMKELVKSSYAERELITVHPCLADVDELIRKACQLAEPFALKKQIQMIGNYHEYTCFADRKWTEEVIGNVIENSIKYSPTGAKILIDSILYDSFVCVQIKDEGIGILEEERGKVFQRFYRGTNASNEQGVGIGLYLAREVITRQKGYIKLESNLKEGTTVKIFLLRQIHN